MTAIKLHLHNVNDLVVADSKKEVEHLHKTFRTPSWLTAFFAVHFINQVFARSFTTGKTIRSPMYSASLRLVPALKTQPISNKMRQIAFSPVRYSSDGSHVTLWRAERALSVALLGVIPLGLTFPSLVGDTLMAVSVVMHQHWGLEAIVTDYIRPIMFGTTVPKLAHGLLLVVSAVTLGGLLYFNYNDIGIAGCVRKIWTTKSKE